MKVKLTISRAGNDFAQKAGDVIDVADAKAARLIAAGQAVAVEPPATRAATPRTADEPPQQTRTATRPTARRGRKPRGN